MFAELRTTENPRTKRLIEAYEARRLYKPVYRIMYREEREGDTKSKSLWQDKYPIFRNPKWRRDKEAYLERYADLPPGSVVIYCPDRNMNLKQFEVLVQSHPEGGIKPLKNILDKNRKSEMEAINERFAQLWSFYIFVDPDALDATRVLDPKIQDFNALCEHVTGIANDIPELERKGRSVPDQIANRVIAEWERETKQNVPFRLANELTGVDARADGEDLLDRMRSHLRGRLGSTQSAPDEASGGQER